MYQRGFAVALPIYTVISSKTKSMGISVLSGLSELVAAYIPVAMLYLFSGVVEHIFPFLLSFSAGAMVYVVIHEIIPELYSHGYDEESTFGFFTGFLTMLLLDTLLGA